MDWLERECKRRRKIAMSWKIEPGDFVNMSTWFGDVWAEVKSFCGDWIILYNGTTKSDVTDMYDIGNVRKLCRKENLDKIDTCKIETRDRVIPFHYPMKHGAYSFQGDEHMVYL